MNNFKIANDYNIYILNNHTQSNNHSDGKVVVTNNATYDNYDIGKASDISKDEATLIIGGAMDITGGTNYLGNTVITRLENKLNYTMTNSNGITNPKIENTINFDRQKEYLKYASAKWKNIELNGTVDLLANELTLTGTDNILNVFNFSGENINDTGTTLEQITAIHFVVPANSTVLVNILGENITLSNHTVSFNTADITTPDSSNIVYHLCDAISINLDNASIKGNIFAPYATLDGSSSEVNGQIIVNNLLGDITAHNYLFTGHLPEIDYCPFTDSVTNLIESVALEEKALANIIEAEAEKINVVMNNEPDSDKILEINKTVENMINTISNLEIVLGTKLKIAKGICCNFCK